MNTKPVSEYKRFNTEIPKSKKTEVICMDETNMIVVLRELAKLHGINLDFSQGVTLIKQNKEILTTTLSFCRFFEAFIKENKPK